MTVQNMPLSTTPSYAVTPYTDGASAAPVIACTLTGAKNAHLIAKKANPAFNPLQLPNDTTNKLYIDNPDDLAQGAVSTGIGFGASGIFYKSPNDRAITLAHQMSIVRGDPVNIPEDQPAIDIYTLGQVYTNDPNNRITPGSCMSFIGGGCSKTDPVTGWSGTFPWESNFDMYQPMLGVFGGGQSRDAAFNDDPTKYYIPQHKTTDLPGFGDIVAGGTVTFADLTFTNIQTATVFDGNVAGFGTENTALLAGYNTDNQYPAP